MFGLEPQTLGSILIILALALTGVILLVTRSRPGAPTPPRAALGLPAANPATQVRNEAILLVQIGGRVVYTNDIARDWFRFTGKEPNLERLYRLARPGDVFLGLCSTEGRVRFSMDGRSVEGSSYYVPANDGTEGYFLVSLRRLQVPDMLRGIDNDADQAVDIFTELNQTISSNLELDPTLKAILDSVERLVPADFTQISIWDKADQHLIPYRLIGIKEFDRHLEKVEQRYRAGQGYAGQIVSTQQSLYIPDVDKYHATHPALEWRQYPIKSYLGSPLIVADELVGALELASLEHDGFKQDDLVLVKVLASQAAVAVHNALMFEVLNKRLVELTGLAKLTQTAGGQRDSQEFFSHLMDGISPLVQVESIGFLIYDEARRRLAAQAPFIGITSRICRCVPGNPAAWQ